MLSKKMAVSLTSLITIFALAFIAPAAMAATFGFALDDSGDISEAAGLQLEKPTDNKLKVKVLSERAVILPKVSVGGFDMKGVYIPAVKLDGDLPTDASDEIELTIAITDDTYIVTLMIAKDIASADPFDKKMSEEFTADIMVVGKDTTLAPQVYGIRRADNSVAPLTGGAVDVIITLSEEPQSFTAAHIDVMSNNATAGTPVKLDTVGQNAVGLTQFSDHLDTPAPTARNVEQIRDGVVKPDAAAGEGDTLDTILKADGTVAGGMPGINHYLSTTMETNDTIPPDYLAAVVTLKKAINAAPATATMYYHDNKDGVQQAGISLQYEDATATAPAPGNNVSGMPIIDGAIVPPSKKGVGADLTATFNAVTANIPIESFDRSKKATSYTRPTLGTDPAAYNFAVATYEAQTAAAALQFPVYEQEEKIYKAYIALQELIMEDDKDATAEWQETLVMKASEGVSVIAENVLPPTGRDRMLHPYLVTLTPTYANTNDIVVSVNKWQTQAEKINRVTDASSIGTYKPPVLPNDFVEGYNKLTIGVSPSAVKKTGPAVVVPRGVVEITIPIAVTIPAASPGFLIFAANAEGSGINLPGGVISAQGLTTAPSTSRTPVEKLYNILDLSRLSTAFPTLDALPNLQNFLTNGGTIHLKGPAGLVISEIMWGVDASLDPHNYSQWIEVKNVTGAPLAAPAGTLGLVFIAPNEALPAGTTPIDSAGTFGTGGFWDIKTKGSGGRTGTGEVAGGVTTVVDTTALVSMQRVFSDTAQTMAVDGTMSKGWAMSTSPALNFDRAAVGQRIGSPGAEPLTPPPAPVPLTPPTPPPTPQAAADEIMITEVMVDTSEGLFPQWIELTYSGTGKATLNGWGMVIDNAIDGEVLGGGNAITVSLSGATLDVSKFTGNNAGETGNAGKGQSLLLVAWSTGRHSKNLRANGILDIGDRLGQEGRYQLLSYEGFRITLVPPQTGPVSNFGDIVGNLHEDWTLPMLEGPKRSSIIRRGMGAATDPKGTDAKGWTLASATPLISGPETFYGNDEDSGTPGYDAGGPLPVELSHFRPARDKQTGQVVITWMTQSELNNAGFFIKRSQQRHGDFKVINPTMIPGNGTTSEKQFYTYTDTTAQPNVVYYYQIEDVSLDGNRQLLTRGIRLKGHVGAAGKATTLWGELKTSHE